MVILAGIIITAAVADGGIIYRAQVAKQESERADVQEIIIGSYVYKVTASTNTVAVLDLGKTGIAIFENLTANGFNVEGKPTTDENGNSATTVPYDNVNEELSVKVEGDHGTYEGTVKEEGMVGDLIIVGEEDNNNDDPSDTIVIPGYIEDLELLRIVLPEKEIGLTDVGKTLTFKNEETNKETTITLGTTAFMNMNLTTGDVEYILNEIKYKENNYIVKLMPISETAGKITNVEARANFKYGKRYEEENNEDGTFCIDLNGTYEVFNGSYDCLTGKALIYENVVYVEMGKMSGISYGYQFANISEDGNEVVTIDFGCGSTKYILKGSNAIEFDYLCYSENGKHGPASEIGYAQTDTIFISENSNGFEAIVVDEGLVIPSYIFEKPYVHFHMTKFGDLQGIKGRGSQSQVNVFGRLDTVNELEIIKDYGGLEEGTIFKELKLEFDSQNKSKYKIYDTAETISSTITIEKDKPANTYQDPGYLEIKMSGTISYLPEFEEDSGLVLIKKDGMYFAAQKIKDFVLDEENNKFTVKEFDSSMVQTGKTIEYTVDGNKLTNKQVVNEE